MLIYAPQAGTARGDLPLPPTSVHLHMPTSKFQYRPSSAAGWDRGVEGMRVGDKRRLTIPPQMAYGSSGVRGAIVSGSATARGRGLGRWGE